VTTTDQWQKFLQKWSDDWLCTDREFPASIRKTRWLGNKPATQEQIEELEKRLGYRLPPSYRAFLLTTNGWNFVGSTTERIRPVAKIEWLEVDDPETANSGGIFEGRFGGLSPVEYFSYDGRPIFDADHFLRSLKISDPVAGDSEIFLLNPLVVTEDGEWEAWRYAHWIPGAERFPSFAYLMQAEYAAFEVTVLGRPAARLEPFRGPFNDVYAPDRTRTDAPRIGPGKRQPPRWSTRQLIQRLEHPAKNSRLDAAKHLLRRLEPHDPECERPQWVEPLSRIMKSNLEPLVRQAAAQILGSYGDENAIPPLLEALDNADICNAAIGSLFHLSIHMKSPAIADKVCQCMQSPRDFFFTTQAMYILEELEDPRVAKIGLRILEDPGAESQLLFQAAFAVAHWSPDAVNELLAKMTNPNPLVRASAAGALRETKIPWDIAELKDVLKDDDESVRYQAEMTQRFKLAPPVQVSNDDTAAALQSYEAQLARALQMRKSRRRKLPLD
jgi:HEAT repeat protein